MTWDPFFYKTFAGYSSILPVWESIAVDFPHFPLPSDFNHLAMTHSLMPIRFTLQEVGITYIESVYAERQVPMRLNLWHDFFNNLTWLSFSKIKWAITERYVKEKSINERTPRQNLLAHLDECGVVICCSNPDYFEMLKQFQWKSFFWETPDLMDVCEPFIIGHGLLEKCLLPYIGITGKAIFLPVEKSFFVLGQKEKIVFIDHAIADLINNEQFSESPRSLYPFPLLGWPGWHEGNRSATFYDNTHYFRKKNVFAKT